MIALLYAAHQVINSSTAPILVACVVGSAVLITEHAIPSPAVAVPPALFVQFIPTTTGGTVAHTKQEERRPGIKQIFEEMKGKYPAEDNNAIAARAKVEWTKRLGPGTNAVRSMPAPTAPAISKPV